MYLQERDASFRGSSAILVHDWATWIAVPLVLGHLYLAMLHPATRHSLRGITLGTVRRDWLDSNIPGNSTASTVVMLGVRLQH